MKTYVLRTSRNANILAFDTLDRAQTARSRMQSRFGHTLRIIEIRTEEREVV